MKKSSNWPKRIHPYMNGWWVMKKKRLLYWKSYWMKRNNWIIVWDEQVDFCSRGRHKCFRGPHKYFWRPQKHLWGRQKQLFSFSLIENTLLYSTNEPVITKWGWRQDSSFLLRSEILYLGKCITSLPANKKAPVP